jgi:predicted peptidase
VSLNYLLHVPDGYEKESSKKWPLILFLHGSGERGDNVERVAVHGIPKIAQTQTDFPFIAVSP